MNLSNDEYIRSIVSQNLENYFIVYKQYLHRELCKTGPCQDAGKGDENEGN